MSAGCVASRSQFAKPDDVEIEWRLLEGVPHICPPPSELCRMLIWLSDSLRLEAEEPPAFTPLRPDPPIEAQPQTERSTTEHQQTGGARDDEDGVPAEDLPTLLQRLGLEHLASVLAAEEVDLPLLRSMSNFAEELAELGASEEELRRLEAAVHLPPSQEVESDDDCVPLELN